MKGDKGEGDKEEHEDLLSAPLSYMYNLMIMNWGGGGGGGHIRARGNPMSGAIYIAVGMFTTLTAVSLVVQHLALPCIPWSTLLHSGGPF